MFGFKKANTNITLCLLTWRCSQLPAHPAPSGPSQKWTNVAAVTQWSLWDVDGSLPEATGAGQSDDDLSTQAPPTMSRQLYCDNDVKSCILEVTGLSWPHSRTTSDIPLTL